MVKCPDQKRETAASDKLNTVTRPPERNILKARASPPLNAILIEFFMLKVY